MTIFFYAFSFYGLLHLYIYFKITSTFSLPYWIMIPLFMIFFFMTLSPALLHRFALRKPLRASRVFGYIVYLWMSVVFFFFMQVLVLEAYKLLLYLAHSVLNKDVSGYTPDPVLSLFIPFSCALILTLYGYIEARNLRTERLTLTTSKLPPGLNKLTIAQLSDLHLGLFVRETLLNQVVEVIEKVKPDIIVSTGDLIDMDLNHVETLIERLNTVSARMGKFASLGNHEIFLGIQNSVRFVENAGFTILRNRGITVQNILNIAGVDDPLAEHMHESPAQTPVREKDVLSGLPRDLFTVLLKHRPDISRDSLGSYDLQLSGHTHKGQLFPANIFIQLFLHPHSTGLVRLLNGSHLYVSRGVGTTACPVRFFSPPEIAIIEIVKSKAV
jgi:predicted MPP superfamily phosphohydrolase